MYQISCDGYILHDPRYEELVVQNPKCKIEVNTCGEASFSIHKTHVYYSKLQKLKSIFEIKQDNDVIFRGRMTGNSRDFYNTLEADLEGALAFLNDSIVPPFNFPDDFNASQSSNVVEFFLNWLIENHNSQVQDFQKLKLGNVTVKDPNNYIVRSSESYQSTWDIVSSRLFKSSLGGYLCIRYEKDGNYIDYLEKFTRTNTQHISFGVNMLDYSNEIDATETYTAVMPFGAEKELDDGSKERLTIQDLPDGNITEDIIKNGLVIYNKTAVERYGFICAPLSETQWDDVTLADNLKARAVSYLTGVVMFNSTNTIKAVDLHFTDEQITSFRLYKNVIIDSPIHGEDGTVCELTKLDIDIAEPQNTVITTGIEKKSLIDKQIDQGGQYSNIVERVEKVESNAKINEGALGEIKDVAVKQVDFLYASGESSTKAPEEGWQESAPEWQAGKYVWQKKVTILINGKVIESQAVCIQGAAGEDACFIHIDSSKGTAFKNDSVSTVLSPVIFYGKQRITDIDTLKKVFGPDAHIQWKSRIDEDDQYLIIPPEDVRISEDGFKFKISPDDVDTKGIYTCDLEV